MELQAGDRVVCVRPSPDGNDRVEVGMTGTILGEDPWMEGWFSVEWDHDVDGHDCDGQCVFGYGWNVSPDYIDIIGASPEPKVEFNLAEIL